MWQLGPKTGAHDVRSDYNKITNVPKGKTGARYEDEKKVAKAKAKKQAAKEKRAAKQAEKGGWFS